MPAKLAAVPKAQDQRRNHWWWRPRLAAVAVISIALFATGCSSGSTGTGTGTGTGNTKPVSQSSAGGGTSGGTSGGDTASGSGGQGGSVGSFTVAFARCMRAHGVPNFPNPNGQGGQLGPTSGINPASPSFQAAVNGPCKSLAPAPWLSSSGPGTAKGPGQ
jgi:hypothetical protein